MANQSLERGKLAISATTRLSCLRSSLVCAGFRVTVGCGGSQSATASFLSCHTTFFSGLIQRRSRRFWVAEQLPSAHSHSFRRPSPFPVGFFSSHRLVACSSQRLLHHRSTAIHLSRQDEHVNHGHTERTAISHIHVSTFIHGHPVRFGIQRHQSAGKEHRQQQRRRFRQTQTHANLLSMSTEQSQMRVRRR